MSSHVPSLCSGVRFVLDDLLYYDVTSANSTIPADWQRCTPELGLAIGAALSAPPGRYMNVYVCAPAGGLLGWVARFPQAAPEADASHAVFVAHGTLPGGASAPYNLGNTVRHIWRAADVA